MFKLKTTARIYNLTLFMIVFACISHSGEKKTNSPVKKVPTEFHARDGLPNFFTKALHGDSLKVAYLGGSITAQKGWRVYSLNWLKQRFPSANFKEINAAIGGTGSDFGVFRLHDQVLKYNPDLVLIEFAVNDGSSPFEKISRSMEGIVRQIWEHNPITDICFVYTISHKFVEIEKQGLFPNSASIMEKVAGNYNIPTVNFGFEVVNQLKNNQLILKGKSKEENGIKVFSMDGTHPYPETGHIIYNEVLIRSFEKMIPKKPGHRKKHNLNEPMASNYFANTQMVDIEEIKRSKGWEIFQIKDYPKFAKYGQFLQTIGKENQTGETLEVSFKGQAIGFADIKGPDAGRVIIEVDGMLKDTVSRFDKYCTYRRLNYFVIDNLENKEHRVTFRVLSDPFDKSAIITNKKDIVKNPEKYEENNWYIGKILIDGTLLPLNNY